MLVSANVIIGIGAGMTIKFFPVFFKDAYILEPMPIQAIMGATALATGLMGIASQKISLKLGRRVRKNLESVTPLEWLLSGVRKEADLGRIKSE